MDRQQIRLKRVRDLVAKEGGLARFAERLGMSNSQVSQFAGKNPTRNIGNSVAAKIEEAYGQAAGWLDNAGEADLPEGVDFAVTTADGQLHLIQIKESRRILGELDDANLSTALGFLQGLLKQQKAAQPADQGRPDQGQQVPEVNFTVGRSQAGPRRHGTK